MQPRSDTAGELRPTSHIRRASDPVAHHYATSGERSRRRMPRARLTGRRHISSLSRQAAHKSGAVDGHPSKNSFPPKIAPWSGIDAKRYLFMARHVYVESTMKSETLIAFPSVIVFVAAAQCPRSSYGINPFQILAHRARARGTHRLPLAASLSALEMRLELMRTDLLPDRAADPPCPRSVSAWLLQALGPRRACRR